MIMLTETLIMLITATIFIWVNCCSFQFVQNEDVVYSSVGLESNGSSAGQDCV